MSARISLLLAADDLHRAGAAEFSEWHLAVAAWVRDPQYFGLRGFSDRHPDHKRVYTEIIGIRRRGWIEKTRPNFYRLTALGRSEAARLNGRSERGLAVSHYEAVQFYVNHPAFKRWQENPDEPRDFNMVRAFLGFDRPPLVAAQAIRDACGAALKWLGKMKIEYLTGAAHGAKPIHYRDVASLLDFLTAISYRFRVLKKG